MSSVFNPNDYLNAEELALYMGMKNAVALGYERQAGRVPAPDTVFQGRPYWSCETAKQLFADHLTAVRQAFGHQGCDATEAPDPLRHQGVVMLRFMEGRESPTSAKPVDSRYSSWGYRLDAADGGGASGEQPRGLGG